MSGHICAVCGEPAATFEEDGLPIVVASSLTPISYAICMRCLNAGAEPIDIIVHTVAIIGGWERVGAQVREVAERTLPIVKKTMDDLDAAIAKEMLDD